MALAYGARAGPGPCPPSRGIGSLLHPTTTTSSGCHGSPHPLSSLRARKSFRIRRLTIRGNPGNGQYVNRHKASRARSRRKRLWGIEALGGPRGDVLSCSRWFGLATRKNQPAQIGRRYSLSVGTRYSEPQAWNPDEVFAACRGYPFSGASRAERKGAKLMPGRIERWQEKPSSVSATTLTTSIA